MLIWTRRAFLLHLKYTLAHADDPNVLCLMNVSGCNVTTGKQHCVVTQSPNKRGVIFGRNHAFFYCSALPNWVSVGYLSDEFLIIDLHLTRFMYKSLAKEQRQKLHVNVRRLFAGYPIAPINVFTSGNCCHALFPFLQQNSIFLLMSHEYEWALTSVTTPKKLNSFDSAMWNCTDEGLQVTFMKELIPFFYMHAPRFFPAAFG